MEKIDFLSLFSASFLLTLLFLFQNVSLLSLTNWFLIPSVPWCGLDNESVLKVGAVLPGTVFETGVALLDYLWGAVCFIFLEEEEGRRLKILIGGLSSSFRLQGGFLKLKMSSEANIPTATWFEGIAFEERLWLRRWWRGLRVFR